MNKIIGPGIQKNVVAQIEQLQEFMKETTGGLNVKDKDLQDVKELIKVKDHVETVNSKGDSITLQLDQLDEALKVLQAQNMVRDREIKQSKKLFDEWGSVKKLSKDTKKEISGLVDNESKKNTAAVAKLDEELKGYIQAMKQRDIYKYDTGREQALQSLKTVNDEITDFQAKISAFKYTSEKFGNPEIIDISEKHIDVVINETEAMQGLWDHIAKCQTIFQGYMDNKWVETKTTEMEEEVKKEKDILTKMNKVDKKSKAYIGLLDDCKKWMQFLPLINGLREDAMRERHWDIIREKVNSNFVVDDKLTLKEIYDLNLGKIADDVEEVAEQAK